MALPKLILGGYIGNCPKEMVFFAAQASLSSFTDSQDEITKGSLKQNRCSKISPLGRFVHKIGIHLILGEI